MIFERNIRMSQNPCILVTQNNYKRERYIYILVFIPPNMVFRCISICFDHSPNHLQNQVTQSNRRPNWYRSATATWWQPPTSSVARFFRVAGVAWKLKWKPGRGNASWLFSPGIIMSIASQWGKLGTVFSESTIPFFVTPMFRQPYDIHGSKSLMICFMIDGICCKP